MKKPKKKRKYKLSLTFTVLEMRRIRKEVANRMLNPGLDRRRSMVDRLLYSMAWNFHQELMKAGFPD